MIIIRIIQKFNKILSHHQKIRVFELFILMVIAGFMEMLSVSLMLPFINSVMKPEETMKKDYVVIFCDMFGIDDHRTFLIVLSIIMALIYLIKNIFLLFQMTIQNRFVYGNMFLTQAKLLRSYLLRPYEFYLSAKSGEILRIIGNDTSRAFSILTQLLSFFSEMVVSVILLFTVFLIAPQITLALGFSLLILTYLLLSIVRPMLKKAGEICQRSYAGMNQWMLQSIQGIKEVKLMRREQYFQTRFEKEGKDYVKSNYHNLTLSVVPRFMIEAIAMCVFFVIISIMIYRGTELESLIPILSVVATAALRLLPAMNRISVSVSGMTFGEPTVDKLIENLKSLDEYEKKECINNTLLNEETFLFNESIVMKDIDYKYPSGSKYILKDAQLSIPKGSSIGIVGVSGSGKTTTVDVLLGLLKPESGQIYVDGKDIETNIQGWISNIGYIPQTIFMLDGTIRENVAFGIAEELIDETSVWAALHEAAMDGFVKTLPDGLDTQIGERGMCISGGQRQRLGIARALYYNPDVLVFDEATSALDNDTETAIMDSIHNLQGSKTIIIIAHRLSTIKDCDVVYRVENGRIYKEK